MSETPTIKVSAIVADLTTYIAECEKFESQNTIIEKHVSSQIVQVPNPAGKLRLPGQAPMITTVMISVIYVYQVKQPILNPN